MIRLFHSSTFPMCDHNVVIIWFMRAAYEHISVIWTLKFAFAVHTDIDLKRAAVISHLHYAFSRRFYPKRLTVHSGYTCFISMCSLGIEPTTFALLTQHSTTEPQEMNETTSQSFQQHGIIISVLQTFKSQKYWCKVYSSDINSDVYDSDLNRVNRIF